MSLFWNWVAQKSFESFVSCDRPDRACFGQPQSKMVFERSCSHQMKWTWLCHEWKLHKSSPKIVCKICRGLGFGMESVEWHMPPIVKRLQSTGRDTDPIKHVAVHDVWPSNVNNSLPRFVSSKSPTRKTWILSLVEKKSFSFQAFQKQDFAILLSEVAW